MIEPWMAQLGATFILAFGLLGVVRLMLRQHASRDAEIVRTQERIAGTLDNHLSKIGEHMAAQTELGRLLVQKVANGQATSRRRGSR